MDPVGIEAMNAFCGTACVDVRELMVHRGLDTARFEELLLDRKTVTMPWEDPVTFGVNAAKPLLDALPPAELDRVEMLIACTESGLDFGKPLAAYLHHWLGLNRNCRLFELKSACYSGTAGLQAAVSFVLSRTSPGAKALVVATDVARGAATDDPCAVTMDWAFSEPSGGAGAVALLVGEHPGVFGFDVGANGYHGHEVMDTCRPTPDGEAGDPDVGLMTYLDACEQTFRAYRERVPGADYRTSFDYLAFHTPFGGMVRSAHRTMMRRVARVPAAEIEPDFRRRVLPGICHTRQTGNTMGAGVFLSLAGTIEAADPAGGQRVGCFSYGSGCCAEFYSGVVAPGASDRVAALGIGARLASRRRLRPAEYDGVARAGLRFGTRNAVVDPGEDEPGRLVLRGVREFRREYAWT
ncbi:3-hydroxy-3-methylglutaryl-ACP synthase [Actinokineospora sp. PR83]|uniref:hydroxymethylglutaryl-CoA synthase family protein n=1 Tax=Actinokineospora sp. PR83 TaxID=2884908 RepID=UPI0027E132F4|nr:hydroxymethylglutaryl-CoA synthase [Actinokineospora sp. PR83]MCG8915255.1 3-hydroxy-3-methylglutaryl-ACP synthase [Actinokineospora sp. PR83]